MLSVRIRSPGFSIVKSSLPEASVSSTAFASTVDTSFSSSEKPRVGRWDRYKAQGWRGDDGKNEEVG